MIITWTVGAIRWLLGMEEQGEKPAECSHRPEPTTGCPECKAERDRARSYRWKIFLGLLLPCAIQSLDVTM